MTDGKYETRNVVENAKQVFFRVLVKKTELYLLLQGSKYPQKYFRSITKLFL